jgi:hypothetical protein
MKIRTERLPSPYRTFYASEVHPEIETENESFKETIAWADATSKGRAWSVVMTNKSRLWGSTGIHYAHAMHGGASESVLRRLLIYRAVLEGSVLGPMHRWAANFALAHFKDKGFRSGFFQHWDGLYGRSCMTLDYSDKSLNEVLEQFRAWCGDGHPMKEIRLDGKTVWTPKKKEKS